MTTSPHQAALILWDVDHTLVTVGEVSREMYEIAFAEVIGQPLRELADMTGRTERAILAETLALHGVSDPGCMFEDCYVALAKAADQFRERMRIAGRRLPGAAEAIAALAQRNVVQSVVTGNLKPVAVTKLEVFELAAREVGVRAVGVATGRSTVEDLVAAHAHAVLSDLSDTEAVIRAVYGATPG